MNFKFSHNNFNVLDLTKSIEFYQNALNLKEVRRIDNQNFTLVFLADQTTNHQLELTFLKQQTKPYDLGDNEFHLAFEVDNFEEAFMLHQKMGIIVFHNNEMGIYFIEDPDGYWIEILPNKSK